MSSLFDGRKTRSSIGDEPKNKDLFAKLRTSCVPLLGAALLSHKNIPQAESLLNEVKLTLLTARKQHVPLSLSVIQYTFFPLSTILRRNEIAAIPDQILECMFIILSLLCEHWWWTCELEVWEQLMMLAGSTVMPLTQSKARSRDDHTKEAACLCIWQLSHPRTVVEDPATEAIDVASRFEILREFALKPRFFPILGQLVSNLIATCQLTHRPLQLISLQLVEMFVSDYLGTSYAPLMLPGVVSSMSRILFARNPGATAWQQSDVAVAAFRVFDAIVVKSLANEEAIADGAIQAPLSDITELITKGTKESSEIEVLKRGSKPNSGHTPFVRSSSWLKATSSQLHISINALTPLLQHPSPSVLLAFSQACTHILFNTMQTMPNSITLLLSNILLLSVSEYPSVYEPTRKNLASLVNPQLVQILIPMTQSSLAALPRVIPSHADAKVRQISQQVEAICILAQTGRSRGESIASALGSLLGPTGSVEKWGYTLLNVLQFDVPAVGSVSSSDRLLEIGDASYALAPAFIALQLKQIESSDAFRAFERMLRALGSAAGDQCIYSIEWFVESGKRGGRASDIAALWTACKLLEGLGQVTLDLNTTTDPGMKRSKQLEKICRWIIRTIADRLSEPDMDGDDGKADTTEQTAHKVSLDLSAVDYRKGVNQLTTLLDFSTPRQTPSSARASREHLLQMHSVVSLQLLATSALILGFKSRPLLLYALYPMVLALVSPHQIVVSTAQSTLQTFTNATAYASPANLLLANFDYALNSASIHLMRHNLDVQATSVLAMLVRLVGGDVVARAGDVVEECFDRLDEYHGYGVVVEGLVGVLLEVVHVVHADAETKEQDDPVLSANSIEVQRKVDAMMMRGHERLEGFFRWLETKKHLDSLNVPNDQDVGPVPRHGWGDEKPKEESGDAELSRSGEEYQDPQPIPPSQMQALTEKIVSRSLYFLTHPSPLIRSRILSLLTSAVPVLRTAESSLLASVHKAWPFIVNRLGDTVPFVVTHAAALIEALTVHIGDFMVQRVWEDVWPRFTKMLKALEAADEQSALAPRRHTEPSIGTRTAYSVSHRLQRSLLVTLTGVARGMDVRDSLAWDVAIACRRFLSSHAHAELQSKACELYLALGSANADMVWLVLCATIGFDPLRASSSDTAGGETPLSESGANTGAACKQSLVVSFPPHLKVPLWDITGNARFVLQRVQ